MNYVRIHDEIIDRARARGPVDGYVEKHHVVPKSLGGTNEKSNIVFLTAREHYLIHWLLYKIHRNRQMAFAWFRMTHSKKKVGRYSSASFSFAKKAKAKATSELFLGKKMSDELKGKLSKAKLGKTYEDFGRGVSPLRGRPITDSHKEKVGLARTGKRHSESSKERMRQSRIGDKNPMYGRPVSEETRKKLSEALKVALKKKRDGVNAQI